MFPRKKYNILSKNFAIGTSVIILSLFLLLDVAASEQEDETTIKIEEEDSDDNIELIKNSSQEDVGVNIEIIKNPTEGEDSDEHIEIIETPSGDADKYYGNHYSNNFLANFRDISDRKLFSRKDFHSGRNGQSKKQNIRPKELPSKKPDYEIEILEYDDSEVKEVYSDLFMAKSHDPFRDSVKVQNFRAKYILGKERNETREKRGVVHLYNMISCATRCDPVSYKGYGCFCGFLGEGDPVDAVDRCCQLHDRCYENVFCPLYSVYFQPYYWRCFNGEPHCAFENFWHANGFNSCAGRLCECDRKLAMCLSRYKCVERRALCRTSPVRLLQNLLML